MKTRKPFYATLFTLLGVALLCSLGVWQLHRLEWKTEILKKLDIEYAKNASQVLLGTNDLSQNFDYKRGTLRGVYNYQKQVMVGPRVYDNLPGYHVLTPLQLEDNSYILVNRGWVPHEWRPTDEKISAPWDMVAVTGLVRKPPDRNPFTPDNAPAKNEWYFPDPAEIAHAKNLVNMRPYILYLEGDVTSVYPLPQGNRPDIPNDHLQYAIYWFTMAGVLTIIYFLRFKRKKKSHG